MNRYKDLRVWNDAMELAEQAYQLTASFPLEERFGLKSQLQRSAGSIPSNIAEGCGRTSHLEFKHFRSIALGSAFELETQLLLTERLSYINVESFPTTLDKTEKVQSMIIKLTQSINK